MKINFAQVPATDVDTFGDEGLFGPDENGNFYYNFIEFGTNPGGLEEVAIQDGCGRYIPICVDSIPELLVALAEAYKISQYLAMAQKFQDFAESDEQGYVERTQVFYDSKPVQATACWPF